MFRLIDVTPMAGDCSIGLEVEFYKPCTISEFINYISDNISKSEHEFGTFGTIIIKQKIKRLFKEISLDYKGRCEYEFGKIISNNIPDEIMNKQIISATALQAWSQITWNLIVD